MQIQDLQNYSFNSKNNIHPSQYSAYNPPSFMQKFLASFVDGAIVIMLRILVAVFVSFIVYELKLKDVVPLVDANSQTLMQDLIRLGVIQQMFLIFVISLLAGGMYYVVMFSSNLNATYGCNLFSIKLICKKTGGRASFLRSFCRYIAYLMPILFVFIVGIQYLKQSINIFTLILVFLTAIWYDVGFFIKTKSSVPDLLTGTMLISTKAKFIKK